MYSIVDSGKRIKKIRREHKYTQAQLSEMLGCSESNLQKIETGKQGASIELLCEMAELFDVTLDYLINGTNTYNDNEKVDLMVSLLCRRSNQDINTAYKILIALFS